jgi:hypothetical protein
MFDSVAFNVVIGLTFIYLLYSLFATVLSEIIATKLALRARNLKEAVNRMLNDEESSNWLGRFWDSLKLLKNPKNKVIDTFYNHPEIKYLGSSGLFKDPSSFKAISFSKTMMNVLFGDGAVTKEKIDQKLNEIIRVAGDNDKKILDTDTARYIRGLWEDSYGDVVKFKLHLEGWFDRTMEQATEWYKRKIQFVLLVLGFFIAWFFNADTFVIVKKLSNDKDAREKIVSMANAYVQNNPKMIATNDSLPYKQRLDSLLLVKEKLDADLADANTVLGLGGWLPDQVLVTENPKTKIKVYTPQVDASLIGKNPAADNYLRFSAKEKRAYFFRLLCKHFIGFLITAIAISLGAPFWFDLLNKMMKLRTSAKQETDSSVANTDTVSPLNRVG